jgi:hypothetical protein
MISEKAREVLALVIDLDERGSFKGHVENSKGQSIFEFSNEGEDGWPHESGLWLIEDGFMKHGRDTEGLLEYLQSMGLATANASMQVVG